MDPFDFDGNYNTNMKNIKNSSSMLRFLSLREIKKLFRIIEIFLILIVLKWAATRLPSAVRISGEYLRQALNVVISHVFIFLVSNVIVLTLFFHARNLFHNLNGSSPVDYFCQEFIKNSDYYTIECSEEIVYQDKQTIFEVTKVKVGRDSGDLRREKQRRRRRRVEEVVAENVEGVDEMSSEEFRRAIEEFIAKQIKFHQQEKLAIVLHGCSTT